MDYLEKVNKRSKRIKLQFCMYRGLIITSPRKLSKRHLEEICIEHKDWIDTQTKKFPKHENEAIPKMLSLLCLGKEFQIELIKNEHNSLLQIDNTLKINSKDSSATIILIKRWIRKQAQYIYNERINYWSEKTQLKFNKLSVRSQKSRWGSCSTSGTISLNDQLLFLPRSILDYIIIHELCHTVHLNHSSRFWALVESHCPDFRNQESLLNQYALTIPKWFRASLY